MDCDAAFPVAGLYRLLPRSDESHSASPLFNVPSPQLPSRDMLPLSLLMAEVRA